MAVLAPPIPIHGDAQKCMEYIQDPAKIVAGSQSANVIRYMQSHAVEDVMSVGYNGCSGILDVAVEQFRAAEASYKAFHPPRAPQVTRISVEQYLKSNHKKHLPKHVKPDEDGMITIVKGEVTAHHLILSTHKDDHPSPALLQAVVDDFMKHPYFEGFPAVSNLHWNTDEKHAHILISNYATNGSRKLSLSGTKFRELRRYLDKVCYEHGLSIIDTREARLDPEHSEWLDKVKAEGKIKVWPQNHKSIRRGDKANASWRAAQSREIAKQIEEYEGTNLSPATKAFIKKQLRSDWFIGDGGKYLPIKRRSDGQGIYYTPLYEYDPTRNRWRRRSTIELLFILAKTILTGETDFLYRNYPNRAKQFQGTFGPPDRQIQNMIDSIETARSLNIRTPAELYQRSREIGQLIGDTRRAIAYDEAILAEHSKSPRIPGNSGACDEISAGEGTYTTQTENASEGVLRAQKRLAENREYLKELNRDYRRTKNAIGSLENMQRQCELACTAAREAAQNRPELDAQISAAEQRTVKTKQNELQR